jgi:hypothetical protein
MQLCLFFNQVGAWISRNNITDASLSYISLYCGYIEGKTCAEHGAEEHK